MLECNQGARLKTIQVKDLVDFLGHLSGPAFRGPAVDTFLEEHRVDLDDLLRYVRFRNDLYARNLIHQTDLYELVTVAWLPGQKAAIHDHAGQRCWMTVENGELTIQDYEPVFTLDAQPIPRGKPLVLKTGGSVYIDDRLGLHSIENLGKLPAVSLHVYAGPIRSCLVYNESLGTFMPAEVVSFPCPEAEEFEELPRRLA